MPRKLNQVYIPAVIVLSRNKRQFAPLAGLHPLTEPRKPTEDEKRALDQADYEIGEQIRNDVLIQSLKPHSKAQVEAMFSLLPQEEDNVEQVCK